MTEAASDDEVPAWAARFCDTAPNFTHLVEVAGDSGVPGGRRFGLKTSPYQQGAPITVSFSEVPNGEHIHVELLTAGEWSFANVRPSVLIDVVDRTDLAGGGRRLSLDSSVEGALHLRTAVGTTTRLAFRTIDGCPATVGFGEGLFFSEGVDPATTVELKGCQIAGGHFGEVTLVGSASFGVPNLQDVVSVDRLLVRGEATLRLLGGAGRSTVLSVAGRDRDVDRLTITRSGDQYPASPTIEIRHIEQVAVTSEKVQMQGIETAETVEFGAGTQVSILIKGADLRFPSEGVVQLGAANGAILSDLTGRVVVTGAQGAHLEAARRKTFHVQDIVGGDAPHALEGSYLRGFTIPDGINGRRLLGWFDVAHVLDPATGDLPGLGYRLGRGRWLLGLPANGEGTEPATRHNAELMRQLHELTRTKGASGGTRTTVGWCAQRLRHITTEGWWERRALDFYRLLGYGERAMPAFATWLVLAVIIGTLYKFFGHDHANLVAEWLKAAGSPLSGVLGGGEASYTREGMYLTRAILAVPLVTGVLSLRHYVRVTD